MRILALSTAYHPLIGGAELALEHLIAAMPGDEFVVLAARRNNTLPQEDEHRGVRIVRVGFGYGFDRYLFPFLAPFVAWRLHQEDAFDGVWAMMANQAGLVALLLRVFLGLPYVLSLQNGTDDASYQWRTRLAGPLYAAIYRFADTVQPISHFLKERAESFDVVAPIEVIPNGVDLSAFTPISTKKKIEVRRSYGIPTDAFTVVTAGRLVRTRGTDILIASLADLPDTYLLVAGDGEEQGALRSQAHSLGVADRVVWTGMITDAQALGEIIASADVFARPSRVEGLGSAFLEAMACGLPVVGPRVGGIPDIIMDNKNGLLVESPRKESFVEALSRLQRDSELRVTLGASAHTFAASFSWDVLGKRMRSLFQSVFETELRVLVATGVFPPESGGPATYVSALQQYADTQNISFSVVPFRWVRHLPKGVRHVVYAWSLFVRSRGVDVLFAQNPTSVGVPSLLSVFLLRTPFVIKIVGEYAWEQGVLRYGVTDSLEPFLSKYYGWQVELLRYVQWFVAKQADHIIVPSNHFGTVIKRWGIAADRITTVHNAVALPDLIPSRSETRERYGWSADELIVLTVGRIVPGKGVPDLVEATLQAQSSESSLRLVVVGDGPDLSRAKKAAGKSKGKGIVFLGRLPREEVLALTRAADIYVLHTEHEGFSHQILEAFSLRAPVVTTLAGGNAEIIRDKKNALAVSFGDTDALTAALLSLAGDADLRSTLAGQAHKDVQRFTVSGMVEGACAILRQVAR